MKFNNFVLLTKLGSNLVLGSNLEPSSTQQSEMEFNHHQAWLQFGSKLKQTPQAQPLTMPAAGQNKVFFIFQRVWLHLPGGEYFFCRRSPPSGSSTKKRKTAASPASPDQMAAPTMCEEKRPGSAEPRTGYQAKIGC